MHVTFEDKFHGLPGADTIGRPMLEIPMLDDDEMLLAGDATPRRPRMHPRAVTDRRIIAGVLMAMLLPACPLIGVVERPEETTYDGVDFTLTCESVEPDLVGTALEIRTNASQVTASRDIITLDPHDVFAFRQYTGCGNGFDYEDGWFLAVNDQMSDRRRAEITERVAPFR
jgi:hypothetical protein